MMQQLLTTIVGHDILHGKWLNALSYLENTGARKISAYQDSYGVNYLELKHAAEEHRHAYYLKKQLRKLPIPFFPTYEKQYLLASTATSQYLRRLDLYCARYVKENLVVPLDQLPRICYLLVTYAIELRADLLYPIYQEVLYRYHSPILVRSIIVEEQGHLQEMISQLQQYLDQWTKHAQVIIAYEQELFEHWITSIESELSLYV